MLIREKDRHTLLQIFAAADKPFEIWAYGGRVKGTAHEGSDLDLVIRNPGLGRVPADTFYELTDKIKNSNIPILVDLHDWARLPESFHRNIEKQYEVLFSNVKSG